MYWQVTQILALHMIECQEESLINLTSNLVHPIKARFPVFLDLFYVGMLMKCIPQSSLPYFVLGWLVHSKSPCKKYESSASFLEIQLLAQS